MYSFNLFGFVLCLTVLIANECGAQWQNIGECRDSGHKIYCEQIKEGQKCSILYFRDLCKKTCGACGSITPVRADAYCRDTGVPKFCKLVKPRCSLRRRLGLHPRRNAQYCRKSCGLCYPVRRAPKKEERRCVDRRLCQRLTSIYNITNCNTISSPKLRQRAFKKCPILCGQCMPGKKDVAEVARLTRPAVVDPIDTQHTIRISRNRNRPPHPPIVNRNRDDEPRSGTFYIFTKYLSL